MVHGNYLGTLRKQFPSRNFCILCINVIVNIDHLHLEPLLAVFTRSMPIRTLTFISNSHIPMLISCVDREPKPSHCGNLYWWFYFINNLRFKQSKQDFKKKHSPKLVKLLSCWLSEILPTFAFINGECLCKSFKDYTKKKIKYQIFKLYYLILLI